ncbi:centrosomal P4.1-associated protein-like isoform X2 [Rhinoraja longicauda]
METSEMSAVINNQGQNFLAEWTTNVTRAGVILNPPLCFNDVYTSPQECGSINDSFTTEFAPLQFSNNSSCFSLDSLCNEPVLAVSTQNGNEQHVFDGALPSDPCPKTTQHTISSQNGLLSCNNMAGKYADVSNNDLVQRLEQLREWQQERQEQLKKQHLQQLQRLVNEQQTLLGLMGTQEYTDLVYISVSTPRTDSLFTRTNKMDAVSRAARPQSETLSSLDDIENKIPLKVVLQQKAHTAQENAFPEGEIEVHSEESSESTSSREPFNKHQNNKDSKSGTSVQSQSGKAYSDDPPPFNTLEERPIKPGVNGGKETFEEFLEKQMKMEERRLQQQQQLELKQLPLLPEFSEDKCNKKKFLKRGEGLARFSKIKSSNGATVKPDKEENQTDQDFVSLKKTTCQPMLRKLTLLNKERHNTVSTRIGNKPKAFGKGKIYSALCVKKVAVSGNCNEDDVFQSPLQADEIIHASEDHVQNVHQTGCINVVQEYEQIMTKQIGQGSKSLEKLTSVHKAERLQKSAENILPTCPTERAKNGLENSFERSFQKKMENWNKDNAKEIVELNEFEFLEQAAEELSFSSNSSFVLKMVHNDWQYNKDRRLSSTPIKSVQHHKMLESSRDTMHTRNMDDRDKENCVVLETKCKSIFDPPVSNEAVIQNVKSDSQEYQYAICDTTSDSDGDLDYTLTNERSVICSSEKEDDPKSVCGKQPTDSFNKDKNMDTDLDLSSDDGDDDVEMLTVIEKNKLGLSHKADSSLFHTECKSSTSLHQEKVEFDDDQTWTDQDETEFIKVEDSSAVPVHNSVLATQSFSSSKVTEDKVLRRKIASAKKEIECEKYLNKIGESPPTSDLITRLFPSLKPKSKPESLQGLKQKSKTVNDKPSGSGIQSKLMQEKLLELEFEINQFRAENTSLAKLRDDKEKAMMDLRKEIADFERKKAEELTQLEEYKKEELKRIQKERMVFEKYAAAARAIPDKKEREEIKVLKQQVADLQEELKRKELRWSSTYTRLRNQIDALIKENQELQDEVKVMERLRLETWKKADTAMEKKAESSRPQLTKMEVVSSDARKKESDPITKQTNGGRTPQTSGKSSYRNEQTSPRNVKLIHPVKITAAIMTRNSLKESSTLMRNMEDTDVNDPAVSAMNLSVPCESSLNQELVSAPASSCLEFNGAKDEIQEEIKYSDGKVEQVLRSGRHIIIFSNGTRKEVSADGKTIKVTFFNGDVKQMMSDQTIIYYYADAQTTHTTYPDGLEVLQFPNNQMEKHYPDGRKEITFPDQTIKYLFADGHEESVFPDGTIIRVQLDGNKIIEFNNGQREIHTPNYKRREYPDGTVKTVYLNGQQETKYSSGRVRIKDKEGNVIMDSKPH